jgi:hypothetical protein
MPHATVYPSAANFIAFRSPVRFEDFSSADPHS